MKLQIIPVTASGAAPDPFELEISEASQVGQLKQSIEAMMGNQLWKVSTMGIFHRDRELQDTSTLLEYAINEMDPVTVVSCEVNNRVNFPTGDEDLFANVDPSTDVFFTIDELLGLQNEALDVKMILPTIFKQLLNCTTSRLTTLKLLANCGTKLIIAHQVGFRSLRHSQSYQMLIRLLLRMFMSMTTGGMVVLLW
ncbi:uncharacterized protein LOC119325520 [Triticum dicoccoides]|uniref:uncharacterized protein LOC119325520 n=1 Tax=Triticum dicoccoides TaxID=85692 RepID=UPI0001BA84B2|nr:uncharacterized protein LOC119325520 [Triticum dicoccoides]XP_037455155.1 uncharacterized protein LOC119325520 [Triticum dicoccoides]